MGILHGATMRHPGAQPSYGRTGHEVYSDAINVQERVIVAWKKKSIAKGHPAGLESEAGWLKKTWWFHMDLNV